jgi:hypothetical protein
MRACRSGGNRGRTPVAPVDAVGRLLQMR